MSEDMWSTNAAPDGTPQHHGPDERSQAVGHAEAGAVAWRAVLHAQRSGTPDHADFYSLAAQLVQTLGALESLARVLARQVERYADGLPAGRAVSDDTHTVDPRWRLEVAVSHLNVLAIHVEPAANAANRFWSVIGHIGVEDAPTGREVSR